MTRRVFVLTNDAADLDPGQTTAMLLARAVSRGHSAAACDVAGLTVAPGGTLRVRGHFPQREDCLGDRGAMVDWLRRSPGRWEEVAPGDLLLLRLNPARDPGREWAHEAALAMARLARDRGVRVVNDPDGLIRASTKLFLATLPPHLVPRTLVTRDRGELEAFVGSTEGSVVLKPLRGTWGRDVFFVSAGEANLHQITDVLTRAGYAMAQEFLPGAREGDVRVVVLDGQILEAGGRFAAIRRIPAEGDLRSNIHSGGRAAPAEPESALRAVVEAVGPRLVEEGIRLAGLDIIDGRLVEINVSATGGLRDAERFCGVDFCGAILDRLLPGV